VLVVLVIAVVAIAVLPDLVQYLNVKHVQAIAHVPPRVPLARTASEAAAAALFLVCSVMVFGRGHSDRRISGTLILLLALIVPYLISPALPGKADLGRLALAAAVILAVWNIGPGIHELKWVSISGSLIGTYSLIGGALIPEYMMYDAGGLKKGFLSNWLAGPFGHSNALGIYCVLALALTPLIVSVRWRIFNGLILGATIVESASRTAMVAGGVLALWWIICRFRSKVSVRSVGTALIGVCAAIVLVLPFLGLDRQSFTGRGYIWAESLKLWEQSRFVGHGINWFSTTAPSVATIADWSYLRSGHNLMVDTLVRSGLVGMCLVALVLFAAIRSTRALDVSSQQVAGFGYLMAFLIASCTEATWFLLPSDELFPVVGLVFAVLIAARPGVQVGASARPADRHSRSSPLGAGARRSTRATTRV
jgi:O-antigen ligase